jgi:hypothetical protein
MKLVKLLVIASLSSLSFQGFADVDSKIVERIGRFEIDWTAGKVQYYGTALIKSDNQENWRPTEQQAWSDGLKYIEQKFPELMKDTFKDQRAAGLNVLSSTSSVSTIYFGDRRIKVVLETPLNAIVSSLAKSDGDVQADLVKNLPKAGSGSLEVVVKGTMRPSSILDIVDESGQTLMSSQVMKSGLAVTGAVNRWQRVDASGAKSEASKGARLEADVVAPRTLRVKSVDWKPEYAAYFAAGRSKIMVQ